MTWSSMNPRFYGQRRKWAASYAGPAASMPRLRAVRREQIERGQHGTQEIPARLVGGHRRRIAQRPDDRARRLAVAARLCKAEIADRYQQASSVAPVPLSAGHVAREDETERAVEI